MKLLVLLPAFLLTGCSVEVAHENENEAQTESLSTFDNNKTTVALDILQAPEDIAQNQTHGFSRISHTFHSAITDNR